MKKRWISLFVENDIGVLARISGLFSGKSYNLDSLTVGRTEDRTCLLYTSDSFCGVGYRWRSNAGQRTFPATVLHFQDSRY